MRARMGFAPVAWPQTAAALGFSAPDAGGVGAFDGFSLRSEGHWLALVDSAPAPGDAPSGGFGAPGLWRVVPDGASLARIHDLPQLCGVGEGADMGAPSPRALALFLEWAVVTREGARAPDWTPPPRDEVESWLTPSRFNVRSGSLLAKGELVHEPGRLALVFPALASVPETLSPARRSWVAGHLLDAHRRWRLARFGIDAATRSVRAEIDLTGVPAVWARPLMQLSLEALAWAVAWVLAPLCFLVDTSAASQALERHSFQSFTRSTST